MTRVVQLASRVPNRLAGSDHCAPYGGGGGARAASSARSYPSLLLAEKEEEERARLQEAQTREVEARARSAAIGSAVAQGLSGAQKNSSVSRASSQTDVLKSTLPPGLSSSPAAGHAGHATARRTGAAPPPPGRSSRERGS